MHGMGSQNWTPFSCIVGEDNTKSHKRGKPKWLGGKCLHFSALKSRLFLQFLASVLDGFLCVSAVVQFRSCRGA